MLLPILAMIVGIVVLLWAADRFVEGAAAVATSLGMSQLLVGMVIVGFGTSVPEMLVSALSSWQGNPGIALGNAYGSNIANITLILGVTALINPIPVHSAIIRREIPILLGVTAFAAAQIWWGLRLTRLDAVVMLAVFGVIMYLTMRHDAVDNQDAKELEKEYGDELAEAEGMPFKRAVMWVVVGLLLLMASSRALVWGAVETARALGVSDLAIGLTIVAVGTSLPEFASSLAAARKNNHDIAVGNIIGSNLFNTLVVVGIAALIRPLEIEPAVLYRDLLMVGVVTFLLYLFCRSWKGRPAVIQRVEGGILLAIFIAYTAWIVATSTSA